MRRSGCAQVSCWSSLATFFSVGSGHSPPSSLAISRFHLIRQCPSHRLSLLSLFAPTIPPTAFFFQPPFTYITFCPSFQVFLRIQAPPYSLLFFLTAFRHGISFIAFVSFTAGLSLIRSINLLGRDIRLNCSLSMDSSGSKVSSRPPSSLTYAPLTLDQGQEVRPQIL